MTKIVTLLSVISLIIITFLSFFFVENSFFPDLFGFGSISSNIYLFYGFIIFLFVFMLLRHFKLIDYKIMGVISPMTDFNVKLLKNEYVLNEFQTVSIEITSHSIYRSIIHNAVIITNFRFIISKNYLIKQSFKNPLSLYYTRKCYMNPEDKTDKYLIGEIKIKERSVRLKLNDGDVFEIITNNEPEIKEFFEKIKKAKS